MEHGLLGCLTGSILDLFLFAAALPIAAIVVAIRRCGPRDRPWNEYRGSVFCVLTADEIVFLSALSSLLPRKPLLAVLFRRRRSELVECQGVGTSGARVVFRFDNGFYAELYLADGGDSFAAFRAEALSHQAQRDA